MENRLVLFLLLFSFQLSAQKMTRNEYIDKYKDEAIYQMKKYKILEGKNLGDKLKMIEEEWVKNNFKISNQQVENIINN